MDAGPLHALEEGEPLMLPCEIELSHSFDYRLGPVMKCSGADKDHVDPDQPEVSTVAVTVGCSRLGVNHCYINDRLGVLVTNPTRVYIEAPKLHFKKTGFSF